MFNNVLTFTLIASLFLHAAFISSSLWWTMPQAKKNSQKKGVAITVRPKAQKPAVDMRQRPVKPAQQLDLKNSLAQSANGSIPLNLSKQEARISKNFIMHEPQRQQIHSVQMTHRVSITPIKSSKINNPAYTAYNEMVRNRIEEKVYANYRRMDAGTVYLTFIVASDGSLKAAQIIEEKTNASQNLKEISLESLKQSHFPPFLKGMTLPEYTFNIEIQYQIK